MEILTEAPRTEASVSERARLAGVVCSTKVDKVYTLRSSQVFFQMIRHIER